MAAGYLIRFQPDLGRQYMPAGLGQVSGSSTESSWMLVEAMVSAACGAWACGAFDLVPDLAEQLTQVAEGLDDGDVRLFADVIGCVATLPAGQFEQTGARAEELYSRAVVMENLHAGWLAALAGCVVASETANLADALEWTRRVVDLQVRLGSGGSKAFLETLANGYAAAQDFEGAVRVYSATHTQARQAGSGWPEHPSTRVQFERARAWLPAAVFDRAWQDGANRSVADLIQDLGRGG